METKDMETKIKFVVFDFDGVFQTEKYSFLKMESHINHIMKKIHGH